MSDSSVNAIEHSVDKNIDQFYQILKDTHSSLLQNRHFNESIKHVWMQSEYVCHQSMKDPERLAQLFESNDLMRNYTEGDIQQKLERVLNNVNDEASLMRALRLFRQREMLRLMWRDLAGYSDYFSTVQELSWIADHILVLTLHILHQWHIHVYGEPSGKQTLQIITVGKLGGEELNLSSDIDLIFAYPSNGTTAGDMGVSHEKFFIYLARKLIKVLDAVTEDGFVFRVDMRLRPQGNSGPLALSYDAIREYYKTQARSWERYALVKGRVITNDRKTLHNLINHFVYRSDVDYSVINPLRELKVLIQREEQVKGLIHNIKRGVGGIREIEFIAQALQLIHSGQNYVLRQTNLSTALHHLSQCRFISNEDYQALLQAYVFFRNLEHRLQAVQDRQTHDLPAEPLEQWRLAYAMGESDWDALENRCHFHRDNVKKHFEMIVAKPKTKEILGSAYEKHQAFTPIWQRLLSEDEVVAFLEKVGVDDANEMKRMLISLSESSRHKSLTKTIRYDFSLLMSLLLAMVSDIKKPVKTLVRLVPVLETLLEKITYISLLLENPTALNQLVSLCHASPWISNLFAKYPFLLDELTDTRTLYAPGNESQLEDELRQYLLAIPEDDIEQQMEMLRRFKHTQELRVAAADVSGVLPLMKVSDHLTNTAASILKQVQVICWKQLVAAHGRPQKADHTVAGRNFMIIAYGKLGGIELGYGSDLDLVFLHEDVPPDFLTDGMRPIANTVFYTRLAQNIVHMLSTRTFTGVLYEVDLRLRPSGNAGLMVNAFSTFFDYEKNQAWTWEHQALVRTRAITGKRDLQAAFKLARDEVLSIKRDEAELKKSIITMRNKMLETRSQSEITQFDVRHDVGGITDIEFLAQYAVLRWGCKYSELLVYPDTIRILEAVGHVSLLSKDVAERLCDAYRVYRSFRHRMSLKQESITIKKDILDKYRKLVTSIWQQWLG